MQTSNSKRENYIPTSSHQTQLKETICKSALVGQCFLHICQFFPDLSIKNLKGGVFDGLDIRKLIKGENFASHMTTLEVNAWNAFVGLVQNFLENHRSNEYVNVFKSMLNSYRNNGANTSIKIHFLHSHLDRFPENCCDYSDEQGECSHKDIKVMEDINQRRQDQRMMADYC